MNAPELFDSSPWRANPSVIEDDNNVQEWTKAKFKWKPRLVNTLV